MPKGIHYQVIMGPEWKRVDLALRQVDNNMRSELRKAMLAAARPAAADAKSRVRGIPTYGAKHTGLRRAVARGVRVNAGTSATSPYVRIITSMPETDEAIIPRGLDRRAGWRHPVFGNRNNWVTQRTGGSWFRAAIADHQDEFEKNLTNVLERAAESIDDAGD